MEKLVAVLAVISVMISGILIHTETSKAAEMNFSVSAVIPDNQIDKSKTYFELRMKPNQVQELEVVLTNGLARAVTVETSANTAVTNDNGIVDYSNKAPKLDNTLQAPFSKIAEMPSEITVPAKGSKTVKVKVTMPSAPFEGFILGGIHFSEKDDGDKKESGEGVQIKNKYAYVIGVILSENDVAVEPDMKLNTIKPDQVNYRNVLKANLQNIKPVIIQNLAVEAHVYKEGSDKALYSAKQDTLRMAPNSNFDFGIGWNNQEFKPGKYRLKMVASSGDSVWKWDEPFEIKGDTAADLNDKAVELEKDYTMWYVAGGVLLALLVFGLVFWLGRRSRKREED
ncbi:DUF916 and DUF3324 domain-containing protein [Listeria cornellensis]|uniref:Uncharacterized protein n=1 Tax=Listeria cornellensis FSL F6-0969 TaxID=1265820 RepID=W7BYS6_9LIST|nr:DUF916 and DUF3324 domain-containing protein [Listeria cornellensis]EUJ25373.1 hypothetical protein PCORN_17579 [Listeria cornellensis FSL F6-0969]